MSQDVMGSVVSYYGKPMHHAMHQQDHRNLTIGAIDIAAYRTYTRKSVKAFNLFYGQYGQSVPIPSVLLSLYYYICLFC